MDDESASPNKAENKGLFFGSRFSRCSIKSFFCISSLELNFLAILNKSSSSNTDKANGSAYIEFLLMFPLPSKRLSYQLFGYCKFLSNKTNLTSCVKSLLRFVSIEIISDICFGLLPA